MATSPELRERRKRHLTGIVLMLSLVSCSRAEPVPSSATARVSPGFEPTIENDDAPPKQVPERMVWIPGGEFSMGANDPPDIDEVGMKATDDGRPIHRVYVDGFFMENTHVTNAEYARFVKATGYVTVAERTPRAEDFPGVPPENLNAGGVVFTPPAHAVQLNNDLQWWSYENGANWRHPTGPTSDLKGKDDYPVVQIAYTDAEAYATWADKRLPTEAE